jgi:hypothetical protein
VSEQSLFQAIRDGDVDQVRTLLEDGEAVDQQDEQGWTPLNWSAGRGDVAIIRLLLEHGADVTATGRDNRTPLMIAKAAGRGQAVELLTEAEKERGVWDDPRTSRLYCKAYYLDDLAAFDGWPPEASERAAAPRAEDGEPEAEASEARRPIVYLHQDLTVTRSMWHGEDMLFDGTAPGWPAFCEGTLEFSIPEDLL